MDTPFVCPVCGAPLEAEPHRLFCPAGHSYDRARSGYVNLSMNQSSSAKRHGDDRLMIRARSAFLDSGAYEKLARRLTELSLPLIAGGDLFLDAGCGEGYYTSFFAQAARQAGICLTAAGADLSKEALIAAARRDRSLHLAVAGLYSLPLADASCSLVWNLFAPLAGEEFARVLKPGGSLFRAFPLEDHLMGLKEILYDRPYENHPQIPALEGFEKPVTEELRFQLEISDAGHIQALFAMTPYYYKTSAADQEKLRAVSHLVTPVAVGISRYVRL